MKERNKLYILFFLIGFIFLSGTLQAQEGERKWALRYSGGVIVKPLLTSNPSGISTGNGGGGVLLTGEIYLPRKWNLQAGYFRTEMSYGEGDRTMEGLQLGVKKYFIHPDFVVQPYLSASTQINWSDHREYTHFTYDSYSRYQDSRNPRLSFAPGIGAEFYIFSSVAFVAEYNFWMGVHSKTTLTVSDGRMNPYTMKDKGMHHYLGLGVKITFPFRVTSQDGMNLLSILANMLFPDWYYY